MRRFSSPMKKRSRSSSSISESTSSSSSSESTSSSSSSESTSSSSSSSSSESTSSSSSSSESSTRRRRFRSSSPYPSPSISPFPTPPPPRAPTDSQDHHLYVALQRSDEHCYTVHKINLKDITLRSKSRSPFDHKPFDFPKPIFSLPRETYPASMGFLASGSRIYMFGGGTPRPFTTAATTPYSHRLCAACYVFETSPKRPHYMRICEMDHLNWGKFSPIVLGPIHGLFYSCSRNLAYRDLEEFNPQTELWSPLPPPPVNSGTVGFHDPFSDHLVKQHSIAGNRLVFVTQKGIYTYHVISQTWECFSSSGSGGGGGGGGGDSYSRRPVNFGYFSYDVGRFGLQLVEVHADDKKSTSMEYSVQGSSELRREFVDRGLQHNVLRLEEEDKVCTVSFGVHSLKPYVAVDLYSFGTTTRLNSLRVLEHAYATFALEETWERILGLDACFVI